MTNTASKKMTQQEIMEQYDIDQERQYTTHYIGEYSDLMASLTTQNHNIIFNTTDEFFDSLKDNLKEVEQRFSETFLKDKQDIDNNGRFVVINKNYIGEGDFVLSWAYDVPETDKQVIQRLQNEEIKQINNQNNDETTKQNQQSQTNNIINESKYKEIEKEIHELEHYLKEHSEYLNWFYQLKYNDHKILDTEEKGKFKKLCHNYGTEKGAKHFIQEEKNCNQDIYLDELDIFEVIYRHTKFSFDYIVDWDTEPMDMESKLSNMIEYRKELLNDMLEGEDRNNVEKKIEKRIRNEQKEKGWLSAIFSG